MTTPNDTGPKADAPATPAAPPDMSALFKALAQAQAEFEPVERTREVKVTMKSGGSYTFEYAPLDTVIDATRPALARNGLSVIQPIHSGTNGETVVRTILTHASGAYLEGLMVIPKAGTAQELGSALTYIRRYAYQSMVGVVAEMDDDGNSGDGNERSVRQREPSSKENFVSEVEFDDVCVKWKSLDEPTQRGWWARFNPRQKALLKERQAQADRNSEKLNKTESLPAGWGGDGGASK